jgi:hypothetical protein
MVDSLARPGRQHACMRLRAPSSASMQPVLGPRDHVMSLMLVRLETAAGGSALRVRRVLPLVATIFSLSTVSGISLQFADTPLGTGGTPGTGRDNVRFCPAAIKWTAAGYDVAGLDAKEILARFRPPPRVTRSPQLRPRTPCSVHKWIGRGSRADSRTLAPHSGTPRALTRAYRPESGFFHATAVADFPLASIGTGHWEQCR